MKTLLLALTLALATTAVSVQAAPSVRDTSPIQTKCFGSTYLVVVNGVPHCVPFDVVK